MVQAGLLRNPIFDVALGFPEEGASVNLGVGVVFEFLDVLTIHLRQRVAESEFEATKLTVIGKVIDVATATRVTFRELQARQANPLSFPTGGSLIACISGSGPGTASGREHPRSRPCQRALSRCPGKPRHCGGRGSGI